MLAELQDCRKCSCATVVWTSWVVVQFLALLQPCNQAQGKWNPEICFHRQVYGCHKFDVKQALGVSHIQRVKCEPTKFLINKTKLCSGPASQVHIVNVWIVDMQSSNKQEWNQITSKFRNVIYSRRRNHFLFEHSKIYYQMCTNIGYTCSIIIQSLNIKEWQLLELQITQTRNHLSISNKKVQDHKKWKKYS